MIRKAVLLFVLAVALAAPSVASAGVPASYPAAGPVVKPSVIIRANPGMSSKRVHLLHDFRDDGLTQYVLALKGKRIGVVAATHAKLNLKYAGTNALLLTARQAGTAGNALSAQVTNVSGQLHLILKSGSTPLADLPFADRAALAATVNAMSLPVRAAAIGTGPLSTAATKRLAGGKARNPGTVWLRVIIPARPLGRKGWIPASAARVRPTKMSIVVNRTTHWLAVFEEGKRVFRTRVATGRPDRPTPPGLHYIAAKYRPPENAAVTAFALELSAPAGLPGLRTRRSRRHPRDASP